ncbi:MAG: DUF3500 domain-containing protein [Chitinophagaceae bacterium]|nr:MAG: DUF3500 domain-containing protein [Chitinophagaceae bacterium]
MKPPYSAILLALLCMMMSCNKKAQKEVTLGSLQCDKISYTERCYAGLEYMDNIHIPYTGGDGSDTPTGDPVPSQGVTGLVAEVGPYPLLSREGHIVFFVSGIPSGPGVARFPVSIGGQQCTFEMNVYEYPVACASLRGAGKVSCLAEHFVSKLSNTQRDKIISPLNLQNAERWSTDHCNNGCRNGISLAELDSLQRDAAIFLLEDAMGWLADEGYDEFRGIRRAEEYRKEQTGADVSGLDYWIAMLGTPSQTGKWMLQVSGHNYAINITYENNQVISMTPSFQATDPGDFTFRGRQYTQLYNELYMASEMLALLNSTQLSEAKLSVPVTNLEKSFPQAGTYPAPKGVRLGSLSPEVQSKYSSLLYWWTNNIGSYSFDPFLNLYNGERADTYISYSGNPDGKPGNAGSFFNGHLDYFRVDGPSIWIEIIGLNSTVFPGRIMYRTVMRDRNRDYPGL